MRVQRRQAGDVLTRDGETAVLIRGTVLRLSDLSAAIYDLTAEPIAVHTLARELESRFGPPSSSTSLDATKDAVADLVHNGVLREVSADR